MKIIKWFLIVISIFLFLVLILIPKNYYPTNPDNSPYIGGSPDCLGISIPLDCTTYSCNNLCLGKVLYYGAIPPK